MLSNQAVFATPTVSWDFGTHFLGDAAVGVPPVKITINDVAANTTAIDTITAKVTSTSDPVGISLNLVETGNKTALFKNANLIFYSGDGLIPLGRTVTITISDPNANTHPTAIDTLAVLAKSNSSPSGLALTFQETGINTGIFSGKITFQTVSSGSSGNTLNVVAGDEVTIQDVSSGLSSNALITPNSNAGFGAIKANVGDMVTVAYNGVIANTVIGNDTSPGGGGGGLIAHPGLVLDAILTVLGKGGDSGDNLPPVFTFDKSRLEHAGLDTDVLDSILKQDPYKPVLPIINSTMDLPMSIDHKSFAISKYLNTVQTNDVEVGKPVHMRLVLYDETGIQHLGIYMNLQGSQSEIYDSDTSIIYEKNNQLEVNDPHKYLSNVNFIVTAHSQEYIFDYNLTFAKPIKPDVIIRTWDPYRYSSDTKILDVWKVGSPIANPVIPAISKIENNTLSSKIEIEKSNSFDGQNLQKEKSVQTIFLIMKWYGYYDKTISDSELLHDLGINGTHIPHWVKTLGYWTVNGDLDQEEFINVLQYVSTNKTTK
jgi:hypothetical protein